jgi:hypothetical protein
MQFLEAFIRMFNRCYYWTVRMGLTFALLSFANALVSVVLHGGQLRSILIAPTVGFMIGAVLGSLFGILGKRHTHSIRTGEFEAQLDLLALLGMILGSVIGFYLANLDEGGVYKIIAIEVFRYIALCVLFGWLGGFLGALLGEIARPSKLP